MSAHRFGGKVVLVTGGNSGMGLAAAQAFAREGAEVVITGRNRETLDQAVASIGVKAHGIAADTSRVAEIDRVIAEIKERHGRIDVLFANAGIATFVPFANVTEAQWDELMNINVKGLYFTVQRALPLLSKGSSVIFNASVAAGKGRAGGSIYGTSKAAVRSLGRNLAAELVGAGIRVNTVSPGPIETPIFTRTAGMEPQAVAAMKEQWAAANPMKRFGSADEVAAAVLFLASEEASYITGIEMPVDGGLGSF